MGSNFGIYGPTTSPSRQSFYTIVTKSRKEGELTSIVICCADVVEFLGHSDEAVDPDGVDIPLLSEL